MSTTRNQFRLLCSCLVVASVSGMLRHYFALNAKDSQVVKRLRSGFEDGLIGTSQLPIGLFDGKYNKSTDAFTGRMRFVPWSKFFAKPFLLHAHYLTLRRMSADEKIEDFTPYYNDIVHKTGKDRVVFVMFHFLTRFLETLMNYEATLGVPSTKLSDDTPSISLDMITQMYHFFYCEIFAGIGVSLEDDLFNRCPNPCRAPREAVISEKCLPGSRECNPCFGAADVQDTNCNQHSRLFRFEYQCNCNSGFTWNKATRSCKSNENFIATIETREKLGVGFDTLNLFLDAGLPEMTAEFQSPVGREQFEIKPEPRFHPFGHESSATLSTQSGLVVNWQLHGDPATVPKYMVFARLPRSSIVRKVLATYTQDSCKEGFLPTNFVFESRTVGGIQVHSTPMTSEQCVNLCRSSHSCRYFAAQLRRDLPGQDSVQCFTYDGKFSEDGLPKAEGFVESPGKCPWKKDAFCWAMYKACEYQPPRMMVSNVLNVSTGALRHEEDWPEVLQTDICANRSEIDLLFGSGNFNSKKTGNFAECLVECQRRCASAMLLSFGECLCSNVVHLTTVLHAGRFCGRPCPHRPAWSCGSRLLFKAFEPPLISSCPSMSNYRTICALLDHNLRSRVFAGTEGTIALRNIQYFNVEIPPSPIEPWNLYASTIVYGPYFSSSSWPRRSRFPSEDFQHSGTWVTAQVTRIVLSIVSNTARGCKRFCQASCRRLAAVSSEYCYCADRLEHIAIAGHAGRCNNPGGAIVLLDLAGLSPVDIGVHDFGEYNPQSCTLLRDIGTGIRPTVWKPISRSLGPASTTRIISNLYMGCYFFHEHNIKVWYSSARSVQECMDTCAAMCRPFTVFWMPRCLCTDVAPFEDGNFYDASTDESSCEPLVPRPSTPPDIVGYGQVFESELGTLTVRYIGCFSFTSARTSRPVMFTTNVVLNTISEFQHLHEVLKICAPLSCHSPSCTTYRVILCSPAGCGLSDSFYMCNVNISQMVRVSPLLCRERVDPNTRIPIRNLNAVALTRNSSFIPALKAARDKFTANAHRLFPEGGSIFMIDGTVRRARVYKTFHYLSCLLKKGTVPSKLTLSGDPADESDSCYEVPAASDNVVIRRLFSNKEAIEFSHGDCIEFCRKEIKSHYMLQYDFQKTCVCIDNLGLLTNALAGHCKNGSKPCHPRESERNCDGKDYAFVYKINLPITTDTVPCHPRFLSESGFHNLSLLYVCPQTINQARSVILRPSASVPARLLMPTMTGLFGLTKVDLHRNTFEVPVLTFKAAATVRIQLNSVLQGVFDSNITLARDGELRARYAQWDTWVRTVFHRTFNMGVNKCIISRSTEVRTRWLNDQTPVQCVCRGDYHGEMCDIYIKGCEFTNRSNSVIQIGTAACSANLDGPAHTRSICYNAFNSDAPVQPYLDYTCDCKGSYERDTSLPFENCLQQTKVCKNQDCGIGECTDTFDNRVGAKRWHCLCPPDSVMDESGICTQQNVIYLFTSWSDWSPCEPNCGPRRYRHSRRQCLLPEGQAACARATPDSETLRTRVCRSRACTRDKGQAALRAYEALTGDTLDLASGTVALVALTLATSSTCALFLAVVWVLSPAMSRRVLEESLWFFLVARNRMGRTLRAPMLLLGACWRAMRRALPDDDAAASAQGPKKKKQKGKKKKREPTKAD